VEAEVTAPAERDKRAAPIVFEIFDIGERCRDTSQQNLGSMKTPLESLGRLEDVAAHHVACQEQKHPTASHEMAPAGVQRRSSDKRDRAGMNPD
jgi:hypothetical protein